MTLLYPVLCVPKTSCEVRRRVRGRVSFSRAGVLPSCPVPGSGLWSWGAGLARESLSQWAAGPRARGEGTPWLRARALGAAAREPGPKPDRPGAPGAAEGRESLPRPAPAGPQLQGPGAGL